MKRSKWDMTSAASEGEKKAENIKHKIQKFYLCEFFSGISENDFHAFLS